MSAAQPGHPQHPDTGEAHRAPVRLVGAGLLHVANRPRLLAQVALADFVACSAAYALVEDKGPIESAWWAIVTASTVGYGDQYPESATGRGIGAFLIVSFVILLTLLTAQMTARLIQDPHVFTDSEQRTLARKVDALLELNGLDPAEYEHE